MNKMHNFFLKTLDNIEELSTCYKTKVGAIIVKDNRIISIGYNGTPSGWEHCKVNHSLHKIYEVHAEANAIAFAAKNGISLKDTIIYITYTPCRECAKIIIQSGIKKVIAKKIYKNDLVGIELLKKSNIELEILEEGE